MKQTAVEWLESELKNSNGMPYEHFEKIINQAKVMEKDQIMSVYADGRISVISNKIIGYEEYYNETFRSE